MRILFWNTKRNAQINPYIIGLVEEYNVDILILAEYEADKKQLDFLLKECSQHLMACVTEGSKRLKIWSNYIEVDPGTQDRYFSIQIIKNKFILCGVHLVSDLHGDHSDERLEKAKTVIQEVSAGENMINSKASIIIGDFNEMPYDKGCLNANGFHGLPTLNYEDKDTRIVDEVSYRKFYNPMWNLLGDFSYPPGTYYYNQSKLYNPMWYMLDQVIISKDIIPFFKKNNLRIITGCKHFTLVDEKSHPNKKISDHFPIFCEVIDY